MSLVVSPDLSGDYISKSMNYGFDISAYAEENTESVEDGVVISIEDVTASPGETVEVPIHLSKNYSGGITGFRIVMDFSNMTPDLTHGVGGYIKENADDILYNFSEKKVLIVWGSGNGNSKLLDKLSENGEYSYKETTDNFFTVHFKIPENAKAGSKYTVSISEEESRVYLADGSESPIKASASVKIEKSKNKENKTDSSKEEKTDNDSKQDENTASEDSEDTSGKGVPMKYLIGLGIFSVVIVLILAIVLLFVDGDKKKIYEKAQEMIDAAK